MNNRFLLSFFMVAFITITSCAQGDKSTRPSPPATATGKIGDATVTINYSSPSVKGRKVGGGLIPYDKVWRAGANEATVFETDKPIMVEGKSLPAGKYSLFIQGGEKEWQFIFNSQTGQWGIKRSGDANFDPTNNVVTVTAKPEASSVMNEKLLYEVTGSGFVIKWENLQVPVKVTQ